MGAMVLPPSLGTTTCPVCWTWPAWHGIRGTWPLNVALAFSRRYLQRPHSVALAELATREAAGGVWAPSFWLLRCVGGSLGYRLEQHGCGLYVDDLARRPHSAALPWRAFWLPALQAVARAEGCAREVLVAGYPTSRPCVWVWCSGPAIPGNVGQSAPLTVD